jgi:dihydroorotate dehydrogenase
MTLFSLVRPLLFSIDPETAHRLVIRLLRLGLLPKSRIPEDPVLKITVAGLNFPSPIGLAAGFDKNAEVFELMLGQGFGFVEVGTVTPRPQAGNPRPRLFRLIEDEAVINRMGFNNDGLEAMKERLRKRFDRGPRQMWPGIVGANVGANKDSEDPAQDYVTGLAKLQGFADYFVVNISSPNTPGLRKLQGKAALADLLSRLRSVRGEGEPVFVKIAPDLSADERADIAEVVLAHEFDGLIVSNTTLGGRDQLKSPYRHQSGGLSGRPLFELSTEVLADMYRLTGGKLPLIGVGGVASGADAYAKIRAGASLVQLYSALVYQGPGLVERIKGELAACLKADGFANVADAVGAGNPLKKSGKIAEKQEV